MLPTLRWYVTIKLFELLLACGASVTAERWAIVSGLRDRLLEQARRCGYVFEPQTWPPSSAAERSDAASSRPTLH